MLSPLDELGPYDPIGRTRISVRAAILLGASLILGAACTAPENGAQPAAENTKPPTPIRVEFTTAAPQTEPSPTVVATPAAQSPQVEARPACHPSYRGACLKPDSPDYDCVGGSGNGPDYTGRVEVVGPDEYDLDRDGDGIGCE